MALMVKGEGEAFAVLYRRHWRSAAALARNMCSRPAVAEEVVQEAFFSFWRSRGLFDCRRGSVRTWILGIVRNRAIDVLRQSVANEIATANPHAMGAPRAHEPADSEVGRRESARLLRVALHRLPPEQSRVIALPAILRRPSRIRPFTVPTGVLSIAAISEWL